ncbi:hypothetical protein D9757_009269 [Collybiopsis confluens]|uniref:Mid2 domain-containing protein n=1 Tax=Collybiopsis confluens TaxID=2823264 RepID=A0A8H5HAQ1_9AGAR|nr:hypothetical protein D9757_009269 [Collybiopsis confluens]
MAASNFSSSIPAATSRPYEHEHEREKNHDHGHHKLAPSTTTVTVSATAVPPSSTASSTIGITGVLNIVQSAGSETVITFTSTSLSPSVFTTTSDGHPITGTTVVPVTTTFTSISTILPTPTNKASLPASAPLKSPGISPLVPVIIGSLVGALALLGIGIFLYIRRRRRRRSMFHKMSNPLIDIEETVSIQPPQQPVLLGTQARLDAETRTQRGQSVPQKNSSSS